jgi:presenilin-like A22 family membrane protease
MAKHTLKITFIILAMFIAAQLIGIYVVNFYLSDGVKLPYGFDNQVPQEIENVPGVYASFLISLVFSFIIAVVVILVLMKIRSVLFIRAWFFIVIAISLGITLNILTIKLGLAYASFFALMLGILLAYLKMFERNILVHNFTELLIYPGIAAIFVSFLNIWTTIVLLLIISVYDIWAVWHSKIMQKMAKFQIQNLGVFGGFFVPYASKEMKDKIKLLKLKYKNQEIPKNVIKRQKIKVGLAILGGGDIIFPIIAAGIFLKTFDSIPGALIVSGFASLALLFLLMLGKKKKFYPAMPFLTAGVLLGMLIGWLWLVA